MTALAWGGAVIAALAALADWWSVAPTKPAIVQLVAKPAIVQLVAKPAIVQLVAKPATLLALIVVAVAVDPFDDGIRAVVVVALVWSLIGDVVLMVERLPFVAGLGAFLVAHVAYVIAFAGAGWTGWATAGLAVAAVGALVVGRPLIRAVAARGERGLSVGVAVYMVAISAMMVSAFGVGDPLVMVAAIGFYCSDAVLGWDRFVRPVRNARLAVHVTYHLAQAGFVAWLVVGSSA